MIAFLAKYPSVGLLAALIAVLIGWRVTDVRRQREIGEARAYAAFQEAMAKEAHRHKDSILAWVKKDTVRLTRVITRYDSVRIRDTVVVDSIVYVPRAACDSVAESCRQTLVDLRAFLSADSVADRVNRRAYESAIAKVRAESPKPWEKWVWGLAGVGLGYAAGRVSR